MAGGVKPPTITVKIEGTEELLRKLAKADTNVRQVINAAMEAGAQVVADAAKTSAPGPEIGISTPRKTKAGVEVNVGPDRAHWYYKFLEFGVDPHPIEGNPRLAFWGTEVGWEEGLIRPRRVEHKGFDARPFLRPAFDSRQDQATNAIGARIKPAIEDAAK